MSVSWGKMIAGVATVAGVAVAAVGFGGSAVGETVGGKVAEWGGKAVSALHIDKMISGGTFMGLIGSTTALFGLGKLASGGSQNDELSKEVAELKGDMSTVKGQVEAIGKAIMQALNETQSGAPPVPPADGLKR